MAAPRSRLQRLTLSIPEGYDEREDLRRFNGLSESASGQDAPEVAQGVDRVLADGCGYLGCEPFNLHPFLIRKRITGWHGLNASQGYAASMDDTPTKITTGPRIPLGLVRRHAGCCEGDRGEDLHLDE